MQQQQQTQQFREDMYRQALQQTTQKADAADQHVRQANQAIMVAQRNQDSAAVEAAQRSVASAQAEMAAVKQEMARQAADLAARTAEADRKSQTADQLILNAQRANDAGALKAATEAKAEADKGRAQREQALKDIGDKAKTIGATAAAATTAAATRAHEVATNAATKIQDRFKAFLAPQEPVVANALTTEAVDTSPQNNPFESPTPVNPPIPPIDVDDTEEEDTDDAPLFARPEPVDPRTALLGPPREIDPTLAERYKPNPSPLTERKELLGLPRDVDPTLAERYKLDPPPEPEPEPQPEPQPEAEISGWIPLNAGNMKSQRSIFARAGHPGGHLYVPAITEFFRQPKMTDSSVSEEDIQNKIVEAQTKLDEYLKSLKSELTQAKVDLAKVSVETFHDELNLFNSKENSDKRKENRARREGNLKAAAEKEAASAADVEAKKAAEQKKAADMESEFSALQAKLGVKYTADIDQLSARATEGLGGTRKNRRRSTYRRTR